MADKKAKLGEDLGNGWSLAHAQDSQAVQSGGPGNVVISVKDGHYEAQKRVGDALYVQSGSSMDELKERIEYWNAHQHSGGYPHSEDGNRPMSADEKLESAKATLLMKISEGARAGSEVDLSEPKEPAEAKAAVLQAQPAIKEQKLEGDEQAESVVAAAKPRAA